MVDLTSQFKGKKVIFLGAGVSNMPLARMLAAMGSSLEIRDKKSVEELGDKADELIALGAKLVLGDDYLSPMMADYIFRSPGFRPDMDVLNEARKNGCIVTSEMEMFIEKAPCPVVGITGSDGKSTTTTLVSLILDEEKKDSRKVFLGGNIGEPLLNRIGDMNETDAVAAEISSFQLMSIHSPLSVAAIKNITPNHLNWHTGMDEYIEAKSKILDGCGVAVLNYDDENCLKLGKECKSPVMWFSRGEIPEEFLKKYKGGVYVKNNKLCLFDTKDSKLTEIIPTEDILIPGGHNAENYATAIAAVYSLEGYLPLNAISKVAKSFGGVRHRLELVRIKDEVKYYNSSIDSSPTRTAAAISAITTPMRIICGGYDKNIPYEPLAEALINNGRIKTVILTGNTAKKIKKALIENENFNNSNIEILEDDDFANAVKLASKSAKPGDSVLLSPASASFDHFDNFEHRGNYFKEIVNSL